MPRMMSMVNGGDCSLCVDDSYKWNLGKGNNEAVFRAGDRDS